MTTITTTASEPTTMALKAVPAPFHNAVRHALTTAFPNDTVQSITPVHGGLSGSLVFKVQMHERAVLLRIIQHVSAMNDPARQFTCTRVAADNHVAPHVFYTDIASGVSLSAFVETSLAPQTPRDMAQLGALLRQLHRGPVFPTYLSCFELIRGGVAQLLQAGATLPQLSQDVLAEFDNVARILEPHIVLAPSHNDLNPGNVLRDGERQWLVDWESACMNDPLFDVACTIQWFLLDAEREATFLASYFGHAPGDTELAKLTLMKQVMFCYYMLVFQLISLGPDGLGDLDAVDINALPAFADFMSAVARGELRLQDPMVRRRLSLVIANQAQRLAQRPAYLNAKRAL